MLIEINTSDNNKAAKLLNFFKTTTSSKNGLVYIEYEDVDQLPAIRRILEEAGIKVFNIELIQ